MLQFMTGLRRTIMRTGVLEGVACAPFDVQEHECKTIKSVIWCTAIDLDIF